MRRSLVFLAAAAALAVAACNTVAGAGRDVQAAGEAVEETAQDISNYSPEPPSRRHPPRQLPR